MTIMIPDSPQPSDPPQQDVTPLIFRLLRQIISLLFWLLVPLALSVLILFVAAVVVVMYRVYLLSAAGSSSEETEALTLIEGQLSLLMPNLEDMIKSIWHFAAPLLSFCIVVVVLKWVFLAEGMGQLRNQLLRTTSDVPSVIAIVVIFTVCLLPLMGIEIPQAMSNIGLVIVGFYFGSKRSGHSGGSGE